MARTTPRVAGATLITRADDARGIAVGTPAWYTWLEGATTFAFVGVGGSFTARKERRRRADGYWKAFRKRAGVVRSTYLGKSADLSLERLLAAAATLAEFARPDAVPTQSQAALAPSDSAVSVPAASTLLTGTLTFCFTDIEASTQLWEQHPQAMPAALARHDALLRQVIESHSGQIFKTVGDGVHAVFVRASHALQAAQAAQAALHAEPWGATGPLRVRMALHTGVAEERDGDYFGAVLNRVARILALGHGGQVLLSHTTHDLVADDLPAQTNLHDLGEHHLKGLGRPERIFQLMRQDHPSAFPPLQSLERRGAESFGHPLQLLATKLYVPLPRPHLVARRHLVERLRTGLMGKLTLISAPAGFGKTTLVSEWLAKLRIENEELRKRGRDHDSQFSILNSQFKVAWVSLDVDDNDAPRFWSYVIAALETVYPHVGSSTMALLRSPKPPLMEAILTPLLNAIGTMSAEAALILDDYHLITTPAIHTAIAFLLDHLPAQLHLIMLTRADPPLPLTRLRMRGELTELRAADLRFTAEEAITFLTTAMGLPLTNDQVAALETRTEGWIAGLQLAALAMQNRSDHAGFVDAFSGNNRFVVDYLVEEVLSRLPSHLQMFLTQTAILDRMCGPLCDAVLGLTPDKRPVTKDERRTRESVPNIDHLLSPFVLRPSADSYSQLILGQLEQANLFVVPLDDERHWYRYHHLFAEVLRVRLHSGAAVSEVARLHQRASAWYEQAGLIGEAVRYALLVQDRERAADLIERHAMALILASSDVLLVQSWVDQMPHALILARPQLALITGTTMVLRGQIAAVERLLADAAPALSAPDLAPNILGELALLRSTIARFQDNAALTLDYAHQALAQLALDNHGLRSAAIINIGVASIQCGDLTAARAALAEAAELGELSGSLWITLGALEELTSLHARAGELRQVQRTSEQAAQLSARSGGRPIPAAGMAQVGHAEVLYEWNDLAGALHAAKQGIELLRGTVERRLLVRGYIVLAQVYQAQGDHDAALESIRRCEEWFAQTQIAAPGTRAWLAAHQARLWVRQGNLGAATQWQQDRTFAGDSEVSYVQQLTLARLRLAQSQDASGGPMLDEASTLLEQLLPTFETQGWVRYLIEGLILQALVCQAQADKAGALSTLQRALTLAEAEGYIRLFVDEGASLAALLAQSVERRAQHDPLRTYAERLLSVFPDGDKQIEHAGDHSVSLSSTLPVSSSLVEPLSDRELEVLRLIAAGHSNQAIADVLVVAVSTVKRHINNFYGKLGVQSRTQALVRARELNLL
jgi:LuxR family transcriptional regulator, maltose regulon positive regulatory protein